MHSSYIMERANAVVQKYGTRNPFELAEALNIDVCFEDVGGLLGMYTIIKRNRFIIINNGNSDELAKLVCAHELGHDRLHRDMLSSDGMYEFSIYDVTARPEYEANAFAAHLLIDTNELMELLPCGYTVSEMAANLSVDENILLIKLNELNKCGYSLNMPYIPKGNFLRKY